MIRSVTFRLACCCMFALACAAQTVPPGLTWAVDQWKAAVTNGDNGAIQALYSANPPGFVVSEDGQRQLPVTSETEFWSEVRAAGAIKPMVTVLGTDAKNGATIFKLEVAFRTRTPAGMRERYVVEQQAWVQQPQGWRILKSTHTAVLKMRPVGKLNPHLYEANANAKQEIREALAKAARSNKRVLLDFGGNWCYDCHVLDAAFRQSDVAPSLNKNFILVHVDVGEMNRNIDVAQKYRVALDKGVPALAILAPDGTLLYSDQHGEFEKARSMDPDDLIAFLNKWKPAATPH